MVGSAQPVRVAVAPIVLSAPAKFAGPDRPRTAEIMDAALRAHLAKAGESSDVFFVPADLVAAVLEDEKIDFAKGSQRNSIKLQDFGKVAEARFAVVILVEWTDQKNPELSAVASNPGTAKSTNKVRIRMWVQDVAENRLVLDGGKGTLSGEAKGPYFGTVDPREMSADPQTKGLVMTAEFKKRAGWLGRALVEAAKDALRVSLNLKDPS